MSYDPEVAERVRHVLSGRGDVVEKRMVGGLAFLVNGNMCCGITGTALMVRVATDDALARWIERGLAYVAGLPAKSARTSG